MGVYTLSRDDLLDVLTALKDAYEDRLSVRVAVEDGLKLSIGGGIWTLPYGTNTTGRS